MSKYSVGDILSHTESPENFVILRVEEDRGDGEYTCSRWDGDVRSGTMFASDYFFSEEWQLVKDGLDRILDKL